MFHVPHAWSSFSGQPACSGICSESGGVVWRHWMLSVVRSVLWYFVDLERCCGIDSVGLSLTCLAQIWFVSVTSSVVSPCLLVPPFLRSLKPHIFASLLLQQEQQPGHTQLFVWDSWWRTFYSQQRAGAEQNSVCSVQYFVSACESPEKEWWKGSADSSARRSTFTVAWSPAGFGAWTYDEDWLHSLG